ncbi:MAG: hypothetical protein ACKO2C_01750 [Actinomycetes bacterium]
MKRLEELKRPRDRFARSINVERDAGSEAVAGYLPVGRAIEVINRFARALDREDVEAAMSITGPYGSGKSSLALMIDALLGPERAADRLSSSGLLRDVAPEALQRIDAARARFGAAKSGFIRAVVTAQREPIAVTVARAVEHGLERFPATAQNRARVQGLRKEAAGLMAAADRGVPDVHTVRELVRNVAAIAPVLLLIDEFGKNLEAFAENGADSDLFLLQELAEWSRGGDGIPLALVTLQHMAFDEYATGATSSQRREWAKVQGRFEDVPFVDSPAQTRALIGAAFEKPSRTFARVQADWAAKQAKALKTLGITDLASDEKTLAACWPLHPIALAVLPDLCERYGQNERTLFSFLAGHEPNSVAAMLGETQWDGKTDLPVVRLDALYDYFIESATNLVAISANASRWLEIDTRIRDASGLKAPTRRVLKAIGILNLVSAGGSIRASADLIAYAAADGRSGTRSPREVLARVGELEAAGLITHRDFADEYRVWQGSDFDLRNALEVARRRSEMEPPATLMNRVFPLEPAVAGRHSHQTGTLRAFQRSWSSGEATAIEPLTSADRFDGTVLYTLSAEAPTRAVTRCESEKPVAFVTTSRAEAVVAGAIEIAAIDEVLSQSPELEKDWVARRELAERRFEAQRVLAAAVHAAYGSEECQWHACRPGERRRWRSSYLTNLSAALSVLADDWYDASPRIRNDLIMRHELSSQAAKARRLLAEAMIRAEDSPTLGINGAGPEATLYRSTLGATGLHRTGKNGWSFGEPPPSSGVSDVWKKLIASLTSATESRVNVVTIYRELASPPFGVREGLAPLLLMVALLIYADELALFEHGTFRPNVTDDVAERLMRNPGNFAIKFFASRRGARSHLLRALDASMRREGVVAATARPMGTVVNATAALVRVVNGVPEYARRTRTLSSEALAVRSALMRATEPDELLFKDIPEALQHRAVSAKGSLPVPAAEQLADRIVAAVIEATRAYPHLLARIRAAVDEHVGGGRGMARELLATHARELEGRITDSQLKKLVVALSADIPDDDSWLAYIAMILSGTPPEAWSDEDAGQFFAVVADVGAAFRRLYALSADLAASDPEFDALRMVVTRPDGSEWVRLVGLTAGERATTSSVVDGAVDAIASGLGVNPTRARDILIASLAEKAFDGTKPGETDSNAAITYDRTEAATNRRRSAR